MKAILTIGMSASGKSTWAKAQKDYIVVSRDDVRWTYMRGLGIEPSWANWKWKWEDKVTEGVDAQLRYLAATSQNVIIADTNLDDRIRNSMAEKLIGLGYEVDYRIFEVTWDEAVRRDNARKDGVGYSVLQKQHQKIMEAKRVLTEPSGPTAAIVDIDGTMALMEGVRGPFEWNKVHLDKPNTPVVDMVKGLHKAGYKILFTSGRDGVCRELTELWLCDYFGEHFELFMRAAGDTRKDTVVKEEIYNDFIRGNYDAKVVIDDRPSVCRMWRDLGLNVVQVGNPYIEF